MHQARLLAVSAILLSSAAEASDAQLGLTLDYTELMMTYRSGGIDMVDHYDGIGASALVDLEYARLSAGYATNFGDYIRFVDGNEVHDDGYRMRYLNTTLLGKYPFRFAQGDLSVWPALGLQLAYNLEYSHDGAREVNHEPNDLSLAGGVGLDYALSRRFSFTSSLVGTYCLTPGVGDYADGPQAFSLGVAVGALWRL